MPYLEVILLLLAWITSLFMRHDLPITPIRVALFGAVAIVMSYAAMYMIAIIIGTIQNWKEKRNPQPSPPLYAKPGVGAANDEKRGGGFRDE